HSVNVCLLALALANRSGFPKPALVDLGVAALFHDIGKIEVPREVLNHPGELSPADWELLQGHPVLGVLTLIRTRGITETPARMAAAAFEHHMYLDASGYPRLAEPWEQSVTGRILAIADCYDGLTSSRVYRATPVHPEQVLRMMLAKANQSFDPVLLKLFINAIGRIPIGSLVLLNTGELAVVVRPAQKPEAIGRPTVRIVTDVHGTPIEGPEVDLSHTEQDGQYAHHIIRLIDQTEHGFDTSRYFL
ncbi:MAG: HD-GYP domain-containing protein, partial [Nitrospirales bacterium]